MQNFSLDIETLGSTGSPVVLSIGMYHMKEEMETEPDPKRLFVVNVDIESCLKAGLTVEGSNIEFWLKQPESSRKALFTPEPIFLDAAIHKLFSWYRSKVNNGSKVKIWSHSIFDIPVLANACNAVDRKLPWNRSDARDLSTELNDIRHKIGNLKKDHPLEHTCGYDAFSQGQQVLEALKLKKHHW